MPGQRQTPLLERVRRQIRFLHYSIRTEEAYVSHVKRFILFHKKRHPSEMGVDEVRHYLSHLADEGRVSASTQNRALPALLFLYREVRGRWRARPPRRHSPPHGPAPLRVGAEADGVASACGSRT